MTDIASTPVTTDLNIGSTDPLISPDDLAREVPGSARALEAIVRGRNEIAAVLRGEDKRLLVITGPCSIHDEQAGLEYASRLAELSERVRDQILIVMRVYFEKPRTVLGWKGMVYDPHLDGSFAIGEGLHRARGLLLKIAEMGIPTATEFLDPIVPQYLSDLVSWAAVGARTTESQTHRQMASGLSMPVGFKNTTAGSVKIAADAIQAAQAAQAFLGIDHQGRTAVIHTTGNASSHLVLRGSDDGPNYEAAAVASALETLRKANLEPRLIVDCSHMNAAKDHTREGGVFRDVLEQRLAGNDGIVGVMLESHLFEGSQPLGDGKSLKYGVSVTDACIGWDETETLITDAQRQLGAAQ
ncbi:MAG: 3-deoxy-7-phosphoheptulonate synthase [Chloroflexi bacterium]|nr:3-deoxy-7-phosphoheptulonate synthase [Chloroflexota bacterium]MDA1001923.1 3-deoxy-7-phosphoheptulonate synthase [Chloroflexota bacterium]